MGYRLLIHVFNDPDELKIFLSGSNIRIEQQKHRAAEPLIRRRIPFTP
jgi:hypothetical protein